MSTGSCCWQGEALHCTPSLAYCECRGWQISGIPCKHSLTCIMQCTVDPTNYIDISVIKEAYTTHSINCCHLCFSFFTLFHVKILLHCIIPQYLRKNCWPKCLPFSKLISFSLLCTNSQPLMSLATFTVGVFSSTSLSSIVTSLSLLLWSDIYSIFTITSISSKGKLSFYFTIRFNNVTYIIVCTISIIHTFSIISTIIIQYIN